MPEIYFDERIAARYDDDQEMFAPAVLDPVVDLLTELAGDGSALELGIGTGRVALPLSRGGPRARHRAVPGHCRAAARWERWGGWHREPFTGESTMHVSVWEKPVSAG